MNNTVTHAPVMPTLLFEDQDLINKIDSVTASLESKLNQIVSAYYQKLGIVVPFELDSLFAHDFREFYMHASGKVDPMIAKAIRLDAFNFPPEVAEVNAILLSIQNDIDPKYYWLVKFDHQLQLFVKDGEAIEMYKNSVARKFLTDETYQKAYHMAEQVAIKINMFADFCERFTNGNRIGTDKINPFDGAYSFLEWYTDDTPNGFRDRVRLKKEKFVQPKEVTPHTTGIPALLSTHKK